jgi:hypothetical protein
MRMDALQPVCDKSTGFFESAIPSGSSHLAAVAEIDSDSDTIHFGDCLPPEETQSTIGRFQAAIAIQASLIVRDLHDTDAEITE